MLLNLSNEFKDALLLFPNTDARRYDCGATSRWLVKHRLVKVSGTLSKQSCYSVHSIQWF